VVPVLAFGGMIRQIRFFPPGLGAKAQGTPRELQGNPKGTPLAAALRKETGLDGKTMEKPSINMDNLMVPGLVISYITMERSSIFHVNIHELNRDFP